MTDRETSALASSFLFEGNMFGFPFWVVHGFLTGASLCGLAVPLIFLNGKDAMIFLVSAGIGLTFLSMSISYYVLGRFMHQLAGGLQQVRSPGDVPLYLRQMDHHLTPLANVRESRTLLKHLAATLSRLHSLGSGSSSPNRGKENGSRPTFQDHQGLQSHLSGAANAENAVATSPQPNPPQSTEPFDDEDTKSVQTLKGRVVDEAEIHTLQERDPFSETPLSGALYRKPKRFEYDNPNVCLYLERSNDSHLVVYEANLSDVEKQKNPLEGYWLKADAKASIKATRTPQEFVYLERTFQYGYSVTPVEFEPGQFDVRLMAFPGRHFLLRKHLLTNLPILLGTLAGRTCILERAYVKIVEGFATERVECASLYGYDLFTYEMVKENIMFRAAL